MVLSMYLKKKAPLLPNSDDPLSDHVSSAGITSANDDWEVNDLLNATVSNRGLYQNETLSLRS